MAENEDGEQFIKTYFNLLDDKVFLFKNRCKYILYLLMKRYIVRRQYNGDLNLHKNFWKRGYLASSKPVSFLSKLLGYKNNSSSVRMWIKELKEEKAIVLKSINTHPGKPQNVFIFGIHNGLSGADYKEFYYIDMPELIDEYGVDNIVNCYELLKTSCSNSQK